jgi:hypothetical protein
VCAANDDAAEEDPLTLADLSDVDVDPADGEVAVLDLRRHCRLPGCLLLEDGQREGDRIRRGMLSSSDYA